MPKTATPPATLEICAIRAAFGKKTNKEVKRTTEGVFTTKDWSDGLSKFTRHPTTITADIDALAAYIRGASADPAVALVTGTPCNHTPLDVPAPRWKQDNAGPESATLAEFSSAWVPVDVDDIHTGIPLDPLAPEEAIAAAVEMLGAPFNSASYVWQLTSRATPGATTIRCRVYFLTDRPISNHDRKLWAKAVNARTGLKLVDTAPFTANQAIYLAPPVFVDSTDPFPVRLGVTYGESETVEWSLAERFVEETPASAYTGNSSRGPISDDIDELLSRIGDGPGREGVDTPIFWAVVAMMKAKWTAERIHTTIRAAVLSAPMNPATHPLSYLERKTSPREIRRNIRNAARFIKGEDQLPRVTQTRPQLEGDALPIEEASAKMRATAEEFFASDEPGHTVVIGDVGLGKTRQTIEAKPEGARILWSHATHEQGAEVLERIGKRHIAVKIEGRAADENRGSEGLCRRQEHLAALKDAGLAPFAESILCDSHGVKCEHYRTCDYLWQFRRDEETRLIPHDYLAGSMQRSRVYHRLWVNSLSAAVVDENPISKMIGRDEKPLSVIAETAPQLAAALETLKAGEEISEEAYRKVEEEAVILSMGEFIAPVASAGPADDQLLLDELRARAKNRKPTYRAFFTALENYLRHGQRNVLWFGKDREGKDVAFCTWRSELHPAIDRALFLDATGNEDVYRALLGEDTKFVRIKAQQNLEVIQANDAVMGKRRIVPTGDEPGDDGMLARVAALVRMSGPKTGFISNKAAVDAAIKRGYIEAETPVAHFGALRGLNRMEDCETLVVAGRPEPPPLEVEAIARALWPAEELTFTGKYEWRKDGLLSVASHEDARCDAVLRMIREAEVMQAIGRLRAAWSKKLKRVILLTSTPVELPTIHKPISEILPSESLARLIIAGRGVAPLVPKLMTKLCPDVWKNEGTARDWLHRERISFSYKKTIYYKNLILKFRCKGQRCPSSALTYLDDFASWERLEELTGREVVECKRQAETTPAHQPATTNISVDNGCSQQAGDTTNVNGDDGCIPGDTTNGQIANGCIPDAPLIRRSSLYARLMRGRPKTDSKFRQSPRNAHPPDWGALAQTIPTFTLESQMAF